VKLRLMGTQAECARLCFLLLYGPPDLELLEVSRPYPNRGANQQVRVYLEVRFPDGLAPVERTFYHLTDGEGAALLVDAWGVPIQQRQP
jgi:hypothetical protein